tara:strand:+ start:3040 stop:4056 length:1017 start_codon:yes stop_codon:yes gene_type:complete
MKKSTTYFNFLVNLLLDLCLIKRGTWKREKYFYLISSIILIPYNWIRANRREPEGVENQYDLIAGDYIEDNYYSDKFRYCISNGEISYLSSIDNMQEIRAECNEVLSKINFKSLLEVGVGELTTLESIFNAKPDLDELYGIDLSVNRMLHGLSEFNKRHKIQPRLSKSNAKSLPFEDSCFDLVYSRHALEQMPLIFKDALSEMIRVSKGYIVLFEPSFEKGNLTQKLKMIRNDYFRGLDNFLLTRKDILVEKSFLMNNSANPLNRTSCYIIKKDISNVRSNSYPIEFVCPESKSKLEKRGTFLYSSSSKLAYPLINGVPILDKNYSFYLTPEMTKSGD